MLRRCTRTVMPFGTGTINDEPVSLLPAPAERYDLPIHVTAKVHRDHHIEVAEALYSVPGNLIGSRVDVRAERVLAELTAEPTSGTSAPVSSSELLTQARCA